MITEGRKNGEGRFAAPDSPIAEEATAPHLTGVYLVTSEANCDE